jgi:hypothetical protein
MSLELYVAVSHECDMIQLENQRMISLEYQRQNNFRIFKEQRRTRYKNESDAKLEMDR